MAEAAAIAASPAAAGRQRGPQTQAEIRRAAVDLFARLGYHATSMRAIAAAAGVGPGAIYHWYPSKEAILVELQDDFMTELEAQVDAAVARQSRPALRLAAAVREHVVFHGHHQRWAFATDSEIRALGEPSRAALVAKRDAYQARFTEMIRDGSRDGDLRTSEARVATYAILLQCTGVALWFAPAGPLSLEEVAELHVELVLGSLQASPRLIGEAIAAVSRRPTVPTPEEESP
ncbi:MAG: TetR family transcriptional regulator [Solirubrobacterales bacterium]